MGFLSSVAPIAGALLGGMTGGKSSQQTVDTTPTIYKSKEGQELLKKLTGGYGTLLQGSLDAYQTPFTPSPMGRVVADTGYGGLFNHPEMMQIQRNSDRDYISSLMNPAPESAATAAPTNKTGGTIMQYIPPAAKGGAPGFYLLADGTKISESDMTNFMAKEKPGFRGDIDQQRIIGMTYGG